MSESKAFIAGLSVVAAVWFNACSSDDAGGDTDSGDAGSNSQASGGSATSGGAGNDSECLEYVFEPRVFEPNGDVLRHTAIAGDFLYVGTLDELVRVPVSGGEPEPVDLDGSKPVRLFAWDDGIAVLDSSERFWTGAPGEELTVLTTVDDEVAEGLQVVDGTSVYSLSEAPLGAPGALTLSRLDLVTGEVETLRSTETELMLVGWHLAKSGDDFFFTTEGRPDFDDLSAPTDPRVLNVWREGEDTFEVFHETNEPVQLVADDQYVYFNGESSPVDSLFRIPLDGGEPEPLFAAGTLLVNHAPEEDAHVFLAIASLYSVDRADGEVTPFGCLPDDDYTYHGLATHDGFAYVSTFHSDSELASVARVALP